MLDGIITLLSIIIVILLGYVGYLKYKKIGGTRKWLGYTGYAFLVAMFFVALRDGETFLGSLGIVFSGLGIFYLGKTAFRKVKRKGELKRPLRIGMVAFLLGVGLITSFADEELAEQRQQETAEEQVKDKQHKQKEIEVQEKREKKQKEKLEQQAKKKEAENKKDTEKLDKEKKQKEDQKVIKDNKQSKKKEKSTTLGNLKVHYIDVGQADATLLQATVDGKTTTMLIDAGDWNRSDVVPYLTANNVKDIDVLIGTHPHADHIGQMDKVINQFNVGEVWMSGDTHTSKVFQSVLTAIDQNKINYEEPRAGDHYQVGPFKVEVISPTSVNGNLNDGSIAMRITYGEVEFMFTGDAETAAEEGMVSRGAALSADILHLGHHGSKTSTIPSFLTAVSPKVAIYSAGTNNSYGHPSKETIDRVKGEKVSLYGTDVHGTIVVTTDGKTYDISTSKKEVVAGKSGSTKQETPKKSKPKKEESKPSAKGCIDINTASKEELQNIKHIGEVRANELIEKRPYSNVDDMSKIAGIGNGKRLKEIKRLGQACVN